MILPFVFIRNERIYLGVPRIFNRPARAIVLIDYGKILRRIYAWLLPIDIASIDVPYTYKIYRKIIHFDLRAGILGRDWNTPEEDEAWKHL